MALPMNFLAAAPTATVQSNPAVQNFQKEMQEQLKKQYQQVEQLKARATDRSYAPDYNSKLALQNAIIMIDVKTSLVNNFMYADSLQSPRVRTVLMQTLQKDMITAGDLAYLQSVVDEERPSVQSMIQTQQQAQQKPQMPNANTSTSTTPAPLTSTPITPTPITPAPITP